MQFSSASALITPFKKDLSVDEIAYEALIKRQIYQGMDACVPVGTTGESATLTHKEHMRCIEIAVETCKNTPTPNNTHMKVLAGVGSNATSESLSLARFAQKIGADAILCVSPYYNRPIQQGLFEHYKTIAQSVEIPIMLYDVPSRTGVSIEVSTALRLFREVSNIKAIKEASGSLKRVIELHHYEKDFKIFSGEDLLNHSIIFSGGSGVISVTGNLMPNLISKMVSHALNKQYQEVLEIQNKLFDLHQALFAETNPIPIKTAMHLAGLIKNPNYRLPLVAPSKETFKLLEKTLQQYEVIL
ncbi:4-hydroxy-tetrahydrodipicolinate synthase [Helicobacter cetorum]|uniref:4-hydroxy-tetrahydrodipicolinate synthase n=1 Tax=Helicobacter cetorum (strain ATCC BAA-540 / CCUG 52418 / MIT 99-5656) TaxID=1163745 RepID=I0ETE0_HELCM|nr:4-hydroxy-tetrahydrodipicolinate synthase [Helicobacter cetorum]AFI06209.1 dihydrodipicolinate synthase [Helicobacter cetorum MIT 99-5656]